MLVAPRPESIREPEEVLLVDPIQHGDRCPLDDLVFEGCDRQRALPSIRLRYIPTSGRLCPIRSSLDPPGQVPDHTNAARIIALPCQSIHARRGFSLKGEECRPEHRETEMVEERGELLP